MTDQPAAAAVPGTGPVAGQEPAGVPGCARRTPARDEEASRTPALAQLLAALIALGSAAFWPGATPRAGQAPPRRRPEQSGRDGAGDGAAGRGPSHRSRP